MARKCERCRFRAKPTDGYGCNYCVITRHTRLAVPAGRCRCFWEGPRIEPGSAEALAVRAEVERRRSQGGVTAGGYRFDWEAVRKPRRAPAPRKGAGPKPKYDWDAARAMYDRGANDGQISRALGCRPQLVCAWRRREGLPARDVAGGRRKEAEPEKLAEGAQSMKQETTKYVKAMLEQDVACRKDDLDRNLLQGGDGTRELERYRAALLALDDFQSGSGGKGGGV